MSDIDKNLTIRSLDSVNTEDFDRGIDDFINDILPAFFSDLKPGEPLPPGKADKLEAIINRCKNNGVTPVSTFINSFALCGFHFELDTDGQLHFTHFDIPEGADPERFKDPQKLITYWLCCLIADDYDLESLTKEAKIHVVRNLTHDQAAAVAKAYRRKRLNKGNGNIKENWQNSERQVCLVAKFLNILKTSLGVDEYYLQEHENFLDVAQHYIDSVTEHREDPEFLAPLCSIGLALLTLSPSLKNYPEFDAAYELSFNARWPEFVPSVHKSMEKFLPKSARIHQAKLPAKPEYVSPVFDWSILSKKQKHCILATLPKKDKEELFSILFKTHITQIEPKKALKCSATDQVAILSNPAYLDSVLEVFWDNKRTDESTDVDAIADRFIQKAQEGEALHESFMLWPLLLATAAYTQAKRVQSSVFRELLSQAYTSLFSHCDEDFLITVRRNLRDAFGEYKSLWCSIKSTETDQTSTTSCDLPDVSATSESDKPMATPAVEPVAEPVATPDVPDPEKSEEKSAAVFDNHLDKTRTSTLAASHEEPADRGNYQAIGRVVFIGTFPYWEPIAKKVGARYISLTQAEAKYEFPHFGRIRIDPQNVIHDYLYALNLHKGDLQANVDSKTLLERTDTLYYLHSNQLMDEQRFNPIDQGVGYAVVYPRENGIRRNETVTVSFSQNEETPMSQCCDVPVVLAVDGGFIGPFRLNQTQQGTLTINLPINQDGIVTIYRPRHEGAVLSINDAGPVKAVAFIGDTSLFTTKDYDVLNDYILMRKFVRALQITKKERQCALSWSEQYTSLKLVFSDNPGIKSTRIQRIKSLLTDEAWLTSLYEIFDEEFELYKSGKEKRYASLKPQIERLESQNQELLSTIESLKKQSQTLEKALKEQTVKAERAQEDFNKATADKAPATALPAAQIQASALQAPVHQQALMQYMQHESVGACLREMMAQEHCDNRQERIDSAIREVARVPVSELSRQALAQYLIESVQRYRGYSKNDILNAFIVMTQNFLTVFSGQPGSGKTSLCNIIAHVLGISSLSAKTGLENADRFLPVSVERGWTGKRDFIGYYNPLNKHFESVDPLRYEAFGLLDKEYHQGSRLPFMMLLDEANLSPMEYYWADFMNVGDGACAMNFINLGDNHRYYLPKTLRFVATINNDHTTETLSPRLIDRAWTIVLPSMSLSESYLHETDTSLDPLDPRVQLISWQALESTFGQQSINPQDEALLWEPIRIFGESFTQMHPISPRTRTSMLHYLNVAGKYFDGARESASDLAVVQKLLPQINGTGQEYAQWLNDLLDKAKLMNWPRTVAQIERILREGRKSMGYYHFF